MTQKLAVVVTTALLGYSLYGYDTGVVSGGILLIAKDFDLKWYEKELVVTITNLTAAVAAAVGGPLGDRFGRKRLMELGALFFVAGPLLSAFAAGRTILCIGRAVLGVGVGFAFVAVPTYVSEAAPEEHRGQLVDLADFIVVVGQLVAGIMNGVAESFSFIGWRGSIGLASLLAATQLLMLQGAPESPRWLLAQGDREGAVAVLRELQRSDDSSAKERVNLAVAAIELSLERERNVKANIWRTKRVTRALVIGVGLQALNQLTGINTVMYYGATILASVGFDERSAIWLVCVCDFAQVLGILVGLFNIDTRGRRFTALTSAAGVTVSLLLLGLAFAMGPQLSWLCITSLMAYLLSFGAGLSGVPYVTNSEIYPLEIRVRCNAIAGVANWSLNLAVSSTFPAILHLVGAQYAFWSYALVAVLGCAWMWHYLPETAHVPLEEIDSFFDDPYPKPRWAEKGCRALDSSDSEGGESTSASSS